nr:MAG TPA: hypothetical protein [Caudoviricetes sp.]
MSRLTKYLESLMTKSDMRKESLTTNSEYKCPSDLQGQAWALFCNDMSVHCPVFRKLKGKKKRAICKIFEGKTAKYVAAKLKQAAKDSMLKSSTEALRIYLETIK